MNYTLFRKGKNKYYVVHTITGATHSKNALKYNTARSHMRALNSLTKNKPLSIYDIEGRGFLDTLRSGVKNIYGRVKGFITGIRNDFQPYVRNLLEKISTNKIVKLVVIREPIKQAINMLVNAITDNKVSEFKKQLSIDDLFHLYMIATLDDGRLIRIEKNSEIDVKQISSIPNAKNDNMLNINIPNSLTVNDLLANTKNKIGDRLFWDYNSMTNNCQDFLYFLLYTNGFESSNPSMKSFIKQDLTRLSKSLSSTSKNIMGKITSLGKQVQILVGGAGFI